MNQNRNIELGTFTWDDNKLSNQIAANYLEMQRLSNVMKEANQSIKQTGNTIKDLEKRIESEQRAQERLSDQLENGYITQEKYNEEIEKSNSVIDDFIDQQQEAIRAQANFALEVTKTQNELSSLRREQSELNTLFQAGRTELQNNEGAYKELNKELNAAKVEAKNLGAELAMMERDGSKETDPERYQQLAAAFAEASTRARELNDQFVEIDASVGDNQRNVGNYKEAITDAFSEITGGLMKMASGDVKGGFDSVKEGFKGIKTAAAEAYAFIIANPLIALAAAFLAIGVGIYKGVQYMIDYNESIKESIKLTQDLTGYIGATADSIRVRAQALSDTFGDDFQEVLKTANTLAKQLGITYEEAFDKIEQGYVRGANANGDFLDRLSEYGPLLNKYGFNLEEIIGLQIQAQEQGLFGDKFEDSIKEAGLSLEEFTKAQSDAISNAFGPAFANKISHDVNSGAITVKDALILMAAEAKKQGLSVQQFGVLTADVFKGAGEDIGGARVMFENIYEGINNLQEPLTKVQQKTLALSEANFELGKAKDDALKSDKLMDFMSDMDLFLTKAETIFWKFIGLITDSISWIDEMTGGSEVLGETWDAVSEQADALWSAVESVADVFNDLLDALGLNNGETQSFVKNILKALNPLNVLKLSIQAVTLGLKTFSAVIQASRVNITAFAITAKSVFAQLADAAKSFMRLDYEGGLNKLKNINISKEFEKARKEAERIVALNNAQKNKQIVEEPKPKDETKASDKNKSTTQADRDAAAKAAEEARKKAEAEAKKAESKRIADAKKAAADAKKALEEEAKRELEIAKTTAEQSAEIAKSELANYIAVNAEKLKSDKTLNKSKLQAQLDYYDEVRKLQQQANNEEEVAKVLSVQQKIDEINKKKELGKQLSQNDIDEINNLNSEIENIHREFYTKELQLNNETNEKKKEANKNYEIQLQEQRRLSQAIEFQQRILDLESQNANEFEIKKEQEKQRFQEELANWAEENEIKMDLDNDKYISDQEIQAERDELQNQYNLAKDENEKLRVKNQLDAIDFMVKQSAENQKKIEEAKEQAKLSALAQSFGTAKGLFKENTLAYKAMAIGEATISTYLSATKALAEVPWPMNYVVMGVNIAAGLAQVAKIASAKAAKGMMIEGPSHANGGVPIMTPNGIIEAEGGEVIINKRSSALYRDELSAINQAGGGVKFANGGVIGSNLATVQNSFTKSIDFTEMANVIGEKVLEGSVLGTSTGSQEGFENLSQNRKISNGANH
ncbi:phage tail tape measure protein [Chryseobacterium daeguense]|uniref:phage tail tape measure protein n=1 Tax=Chryseobacterium daeguense TaxID=412438 RepID=UPI000400B459|nr:phage tail tape measure protein [Chryseobacterium daeguense]